MKRRILSTASLLGLAALACGATGGCPAPDVDVPEPPPPPPPPMVTSCGLVGRDCIVQAGALPLDVDLADFDGDTDLDLAIVLSGSDSIVLFLNDGTGIFADPTLLHVGEATRSAAAGDFDGDGDVDLAAANAADVLGDAVSVLPNQGNATFGTSADFAITGLAGFVASGDLDGDGDTDLATANAFSNSLSVLLNNGDGTFAEDTPVDVGSLPHWVEIADLDGDGQPDLVSANKGSDDVSIVMNAGDGSFTPDVEVDAGDSPRAVVGADLDGDGDTDLAVANEGVFDDPVSSTVSLLVNDGTGAFLLAATLPVGVNPYAITAGDLDNDGDTDLVVANHGTTADTSTIAVLLNNGDGTFAEAVAWLVGFGPEAVALGDLDGDGDLDVATANSVGGDVTLLANDGSGGFAADN